MTGGSENRRRSTRRHATVVYIDRLCLLSGLRLVVVALSRRVAHVRYLSSDAAGRFLLRSLTLFRLCRNSQQLAPDLTVSSHRGGSVFDWSHLLARRVGQRVTKRMCAGRSVADLLPEGVRPQRGRGLLQKMIQLECYDAILLAVLAEEHLRSRGDGGQVIVIAGVSDLVSEISRNLGDEVEASFVGYRGARKSAVTSLIRFLATLVVWSWGRLFASFWDKSGERPSPTVAVQYLHGLDGPSFLTNDLWWYPASGMPAEKCTMFFDRVQSPATDEILVDIERRGHQALILRRGSNRSSHRTHGFPLQPFGRTLEDIRLLASVLVRARSFVAPRWQVGLWLKTMIPVRRWQRLMEVANVRVVFSVGETTRDSLSIAADLAGALRVGYHWSAIYPLNARHLPLHQVYFVWGPRNTSMFSGGERDYTDALLLGGCIFDLEDHEHFPAEHTATARAEVGLPDVQHVVAAFDKSIGGYYRANRHVEFYDALVSWAESDPSVGLIFKFKSQRVVPEAFRHSPDLERRVGALVAAGRVVLMDGTHSVGDAARLADVVVGMGWNSAGIVASILGMRTVFWDAAGLLDGPAREGVQRVEWDNPAVVFADLDELIETVRCYFARPTDMPELGKLTRGLDDIDPFRDGKGAERIGSFVRSFLEKLDDGLDRANAVDRALETYAQRWGSDAVARVGGEAGWQARQDAW